MTGELSLSSKIGTGFDQADTKELLPETSRPENPYNLRFGYFLSNGFKSRTTEGSINSNGASVLYIAWAENPFASNNRAC